MDLENKHNRIIIQPNSFSTAEYSFSIFQRDIILFIQSLISRNSPVTESFYISKRDYAKYRGVDYNDLRVKIDNEYSSFDKRMVDAIAPMALKIKLPNHYIHLNLWSSVVLMEPTEENPDPTIHVKINKDAMQIFFPNRVEHTLQHEITKNYTKYDRFVIQDSNSTITRKLIELLSTRSNGATQDRPLVYTIQEFRLIMGFSVAHRKKYQDQENLFEVEAYEVEDLVYKENRDLKKCLDRSVNEIKNIKNNHIVNLSMKFIKVGRSYRKIAFSFINLNGNPPKEINDLMKAYGLSSRQAYIFYKAYKNEAEIIIHTRLAKTLTFDQIKDDSGNIIRVDFYFRSNNEKVNNNVAYIISIFPELFKKEPELFD